MVAAAEAKPKSTAEMHELVRLMVNAPDSIVTVSHETNGTIEVTIHCKESPDMAEIGLRMLMGSRR